MPDTEETKAIKAIKAKIVKSFTDLIKCLNSDYTILQDIDLQGNFVCSKELYSIGLVKNGELKNYICVKNDSIEIIYQRISKLVLTVVKEVNHEII